MKHDGHVKSSFEINPTLPSSSSPSSSLSSLTSSGSIRPTAPYYSSQSDLGVDSCDSEVSSAEYKQSLSSPIADSIAPNPRTSSLRSMGQTFSRVQAPLPPTPSISNPESTLTAGQRLKRAFINVRKKSVDSARAVSQPTSPSKNGKDRGRSDSLASQWRGPSFPALSLTTSRRSKSPAPSSGAQSPKRSRFGPSSPIDLLRLKRGTTPEPRPPPLPSSVPPPVPPKPSLPSITLVETKLVKEDTPKEAEVVTIPFSSKESELPELPTTPNSANDQPLHNDNVHEVPNENSITIDNPLIVDTPPSEPMRRPEKSSHSERNAEETEAWRKSDSTMRTVRAIPGSRTPRPLSIAESSHSGHTVTVQQQSHRFSTFTIDPDNSTSEVETESDSVDEDAERESSIDDRSHARMEKLLSRRKSAHRHSLSLSISSLNPVSGSMAVGKISPSSFADIPHHPISDNTTGLPNDSDEEGFSSSSVGSFPVFPGAVNSPDAVSAPGQGFRGRLTAWASMGKASHSTISLVNSSIYNDGQNSASPALPSLGAVQTQNKGLRQTAISMTNGIAKGLGKKAADKLGRAWGGASASSASINSSASSTDMSASSTLKPGKLQHNIPTSAPISTLQHTSPFNRTSRRSRATQQPSGSWSISSSSGTSDSDVSSKPSGPFLGKMLRSPMSATGGIVFGRPLAECVKSTAVEVVNKSTNKISAEISHSELDGIMNEECIPRYILEGRRLPALILRCAQHLQRWGLQEEGLFRITGRHAHVNKLRREFDTGADFELSECGPGDIDPHAVASIFKAYLRELPEQLLTRSLAPFFDAALATENTAVAEEDAAKSAGATESKVPPTGGAYFGSLRKAPSLSTLGLPTMSTKVPSSALVHTLKSLVSRLPTENRDVLQTVAELIWFTAKRSKQTKMPLSNLLLIFCPSLSMSPALLRLFCEYDQIFNVDSDTMEEENVDGDVTVIANTAEYWDVDDVQEVVDAEEMEEVYNDGYESDSTRFSTSEQGFLSRGNIREPPLLIADDSNTEDSSEAASVNIISNDAPETTYSTSITNEEDISEESRPTTILNLGIVLTEQYISPCDTYAVPTLNSSIESFIAQPEVVESKEYTTKRGDSEELTPSIAKIQSDLPFPSPLSLIRSPTNVTAGSVPTTPVTPTPKLSVFSSSSPDLARVTDVSTEKRRPIRPSLRLSLRKRSISSLLRLSTTSDYKSALSPSSIDFSPINLSSAPPVLDIPFEHSPLSLGLDEDIETSGDVSGAKNHPVIEADTSMSSEITVSQIALQVPSISQNSFSSSFLDFSRTSSASSAYTPTIFYTPPMGNRALENKPSQNSLRSSRSYSFLDSPEEESEMLNEDWAQSVLLAAEVHLPSSAA